MVHPGSSDWCLLRKIFTSPDHNGRDEMKIYQVLLFIAVVIVGVNCEYLFLYDNSEVAKHKQSIIMFYTFNYKCEIWLPTMYILWLYSVFIYTYMFEIYSSYNLQFISLESILFQLWYFHYTIIRLQLIRMKNLLFQFCLFSQTHKHCSI